MAVVAARAEEPAPVVRAVEVSGLKQIDKTSVRQKIYSQIGKPLNRVRVSEDSLLSPPRSSIRLPEKVLSASSVGVRSHSGTVR